MADIGDRGDRGRKRRRRGGRKDRGPEKSDLPSSQPLTKPPIILAKPPLDRDRLAQSPPLESAPKLSADRSSEDRERPPPSKPLIMLKPRDRERSDREESQRSFSSTSPSIPSILANEGLTQPTYQIQRNPSVNPTTTVEVGSASRLTPVPEMTFGSKLVDDSLMWCDGPIEMLLDQTDFLTVGVLGSQGVGKSTLLSLLAGNNPSDPHKSFVFRPQTKEVRDVGGHQTLGIDMFVTSERIMFLDSQAVMSASILDHMVHHDKKFATEYSSAENCLEMQSLMVATFLMTVCNVVLVVMEWFVDFDLLQFIQTAEMLKPSTPSSGHDIGSASDDSQSEHFPHIVFVVNKATRQDFSPDMCEKMRDILNSVFAQSKLKYKSGVNLVSTGALPVMFSPNVMNDPNLFLLPKFNFQHNPNTNHNNSGVLSLLPSYQGHPSFENLLRLLRNNLLAVPRSLLTHTTLSEKNWFHYAARTWEAIKKSQLLAEYNRLLP